MYQEDRQMEKEPLDEGERRVSCAQALYLTLVQEIFIYKNF